MSEPDVLSIDNTIRKQFLDEYERLPIFRNQLKDMDTTLKSSKLKGRMQRSLLREYDRLKSHIQEVEAQIEYNFYLANSVSFVEDYKKMLKIPIKMNFMGRPVKKSKAKRVLIKSYLAVASKYINIVDKAKSSKPPPVV